MLIPEARSTECTSIRVHPIERCRIKTLNFRGRILGRPRDNAHDPIQWLGGGGGTVPETVKIEHLGPRCPPSDKRRSSPCVRRCLNNAWPCKRLGERPMGLKRHRRGAKDAGGLRREGPGRPLLANRVSYLNNTA